MNLLRLHLATAIYLVSANASGHPVERLAAHVSVLSQSPYLVEYSVRTIENLPTVEDLVGGTVVRRELQSLSYPPGLERPDSMDFTYASHPDGRFVFGYPLRYPVGDGEYRPIRKWVLFDLRHTWVYDPEVRINAQRRFLPRIDPLPGDVRVVGPILQLPSTYLYPVICFVESTLESPVDPGAREFFATAFLGALMQSDGGMVPSVETTIIGNKEPRPIRFDFDVLDSKRIRMTATTEVFRYHHIFGFDPDSDEPAPQTITRIIGRELSDGGYMVHRIEEVTVNAFTVLDDDSFARRAVVELPPEKGPYPVTEHPEVSDAPFIR